MKQRVRDILDQGDALFTKRQALTTLWQEIADNFYPERADFTTSRSIGTDFASHLMSSYPIIARRELANSFSSMLRPSGRPWFSLRMQDEDRMKDTEARAWLEYAAGVCRRAMYERKAAFVRATKEADGDFATFGQAVLQPGFNRNMDGLLFRTWHLRDCVWAENEELQIDTFHRKWKLPVRSLYARFPGKAAPQCKELLAREPNREIEVRHVVMPFRDYDLVDKDGYTQRREQPFVSIYVDKEHETILEEVGVPDLGYVIPRWQTVSGSQYAHSPATVAALADARLLQRMTLTLLEAGEKAVDPPLVAVQEALLGGVNIYAGGVTYLDATYDEKLGEALRPLQQDRGQGLAFGDQTLKDARELISHAFFLNKINLPEPTRDMTAFEVSKRMDEYVRGALPLFEPAEVEYNGQLCDYTMALLLRANAFGPPDSLPAAVQGAEAHFVFESPLQSATDRSKAEAFNEAALLLKQAAEMATVDDGTLDVNQALRDALEGVRAPAAWVRSKEAQASFQQAQAQASQAAQQAEQIGQQAQIAEQVGNAAQSLQGAGILPTNPIEMMAGKQAQVANVHKPEPAPMRQAA